MTQVGNKPTVVGVHDYVVISNSRKLKGSGLSVGDVGLVVSSKQLPEKRSDPYLTRTYVVLAMVDTETGEPNVPGPDNDHKVFLVDPRNVTVLPPSKDK